MSYKIIRGSSTFLYGISSPQQFEEWLITNSKAIGLAFVGRSNVGKSSLINSLFGNKTARISKTPGRTREINIFSFKLSYDNQEVEDLPEFYLFDLPGYGHAKVSKEMAKNWDALMSLFFQYAPKTVAMVNLQDARHPNQKVDQSFHKFLKGHHFDVTLAFNKIDKLKTQKERAALNKEKAALFKEYQWVKEIHFVSAEKGQGLPELEDSLVTGLLEYTNES